MEGLEASDEGFVVLVVDVGQRLGVVNRGERSAPGVGDIPPRFSLDHLSDLRAEIGILVGQHVVAVDQSLLDQGFEFSLLPARCLSLFVRGVDSLPSGFTLAGRQNGVAERGYRGTGELLREPVGGV